MSKSILSYFENREPIKEDSKTISFDDNTYLIAKQKTKKPELNKSSIDKRKKEILKKLVEFYSTYYEDKSGKKVQYNKTLLVPIVKQQTTISLRLLDWLVTNYSKKYDVRYQLGNNKHSGYILSSENFNLYLEYKNQLKAYSKSSFDPFCRRQRIFYNIKTDEIFVFPKKKDSPDEHEQLIKEYSEREDGIVTTVGQLNFFKWAIEKEVIDYAFENVQKIEADMLSSADARTTAKKTSIGEKPKRQVSKNNSARFHELKVIVEFPN